MYYRDEHPSLNGGGGERFAQQRLNVELGQLLHLDGAPQLKYPAQVVGQLGVDWLDKLQELGDLRRMCGPDQIDTVLGENTRQIFSKYVALNVIIFLGWYWWDNKNKLRKQHDLYWYCWFEEEKILLATIPL